ncbi:MAG: hypothetical protein HYX67_08940 [Candidatus Melainabacteria bacterium]|nr:hypothetical protein [Candidatus Melainabacteria bacterium]
MFETRKNPYTKICVVGKVKNKCYTIVFLHELLSSEISPENGIQRELSGGFQVAAQIMEAGESGFGRAP